MAAEVAGGEGGKEHYYLDFSASFDESIDRVSNGV